MANSITDAELDNIRARADIRLNEYNIQDSLDNTKFINKTAVPDIIKEKEGDLSSCSNNSTIADILNLNTIRGGSKMINGGGCGCSGMSGGCFTCKKGAKNIMLIYKTVHVVIPELYSKYKKDAGMKGIAKKIKKNKTI
jgi:hypothetical protein